VRCIACNVELNDFEATRKNSEGYVDLCNYCYSSVSSLQSTDRMDLIKDSDNINSEELCRVQLEDI
jgi:hypothetical protein